MRFISKISFLHGWFYSAGLKHAENAKSVINVNHIGIKLFWVCRLGSLDDYHP